MVKHHNKKGFLSSRFAYFAVRGHKTFSSLSLNAGCDGMNPMNYDVVHLPPYTNTESPNHTSTPWTLSAGINHICCRLTANLMLLQKELPEQ